MSADGESRELASEALPRVSPELALVDAAMADGLRRREQVLARRRRLPFPALRIVPDSDDPPPSFPTGSDEPVSAA